MAPAPVDADRPLYRRVARQTTPLAKRMVAAFADEVPLYRQLPREQVAGEITAITVDNLRLFLRCLRERRTPTDAELAPVRASAARRAEERVPLEALIDAYHVGGRLVWQALVDAAGPADRDDLVAAVQWVLRYLQHVTAAVAAAYLEEQQAIYGEERDARRALAEALMTGAPTEGLSGRLGVAVASAYAVVALRLGTHPDEADAGGVAGSVAVRRKLRRVQERFDELAGEPVLGQVGPSGGTVLLPCSDDPEPLLDRLAEVVDGLREAAGVPVHAAAVSCPDVGSLADCVRRAAEVLDLVTRLGRPPGVYQLADVLLEYQLSRDTEALPLLAALLDPLQRNPDLLTTLEAHLSTDLDRRRTAALLHVHPNTLDYRLRRVVALTGLDPSQASGLQLLGAAVAARRLRQA